MASQTNLTLEQFTGPLDLLLSLLNEEKLNISDISLSHVTEQFMAHLTTIEERRAEELADFLVIAARLLLMKSRLLLPQFGLEEEEGPRLEDQLRLYKTFLDASKKLNRLWLRDTRAVFRIEPPRMPDIFSPPTNATLSTLHEGMLQLITRLTPPKPLPETRIDAAISMKEKLEHIRSFLSRVKEASFHSFLKEARNRTEIIVSFLALLELVKEQVVSLKQEEGNGDIIITRV